MSDSTIWKYELVPGDQRITMPAGAVILSAALDPMGTPCIWAMVRSDLPLTSVHDIRIYGTGHRVPGRSEGGSIRLIGTIVMKEDGLVWHVMEAVS